MAEERRLAHALLGHVLAHEIGHLLLRSNSHSVSGIMSARWTGEELRRLSEGAMFFTPLESKVMAGRLSTLAADIDKKVLDAVARWKYMPRPAGCGVIETKCP